jgi:hypothetical protein
VCGGAEHGQVRLNRSTIDVGSRFHPALLALSLVALGCGLDDDSLQTPGFVSGSRLRARVFDAGGGAVSFQGWYDSELQDGCWFGNAEDGRRRCLPLISASSVFRDASCTDELVFTSEECADAPRYAITTVRGEQVSCAGETRVRVREVGELITVPEVFYPGGTGDCVSSGPPPMGSTLRALGAEVPPETFVGANIVEQERGSELAARLLVADDGARELVGITDLRRGAPCAEWSFEGDDRRCAPTWIETAYAPGNLFTDATCIEPVGEIWQPNETCAPPAVVVSFTPGQACTPGTSLMLHAGAEVPVSAVHAAHMDSGVSTCEPIVPVPQYSYGFYRPGEPVKASDYPALQTKTFGSGPITTKGIADASGEPLQNALQLYEGETMCAVTLFSDGLRRCLHDVATFDDSWQLYADAACTRRVVEVYSGDCPTPAPQLAAHYVATSCGGSIASLHSIELFQGGTVYNLVAETNECAGFQVGTGSSYYEVGPEVGNDAFATVTERIE